MIMCLYCLCQLSLCYQVCLSLSNFNLVQCVNVHSILSNRSFTLNAVFCYFQFYRFSHYGCHLQLFLWNNVRQGQEDCFHSSCDESEFEKRMEAREMGQHNKQAQKTS